MERALQVRNWQRSRQVDEQVIPYFERAETWINPMLEEGRGLDRTKFATLLDEYYDLRGWERQSGRPTRAKLEQLGLGGVADELDSLGLLP
jgi:aldehyde:ferredoxin oxidoreductase